MPRHNQANRNRWPSTQPTNANETERHGRRRPSTKRFGAPSGSATVIRLLPRPSRKLVEDKPSEQTEAKVLRLPVRNLRAEVEQAFRDAKHGDT